MPKVVRLRYRDPNTGHDKYLQTNIEIHGTREKAKKYLEDKRDVIVDKLKQTKVKEPEAKDPEAKDPEAKDPETKEPDYSEVSKVELDNGCSPTDFNLMNMKFESSPLLDQIFNNLQFSPFTLDMDINKTGIGICIYGSGKSGKTYLLKHILDKYVSGKGCAVLMAENIHSDAYSQYPADIIKTDGYSPILIKAAARINKRLNNKYAFTFILDDIIDKKNDAKLESLYLTLRNSKLSCITLQQCVQNMKSTSRSNSNIHIFKKFNSPITVENYILKHYIGNYPPFKDLSTKDAVSLYFRITNTDYNFFVLDSLNNTLILCRGVDLK
jgi:hypothetical protein